MKAYITLLSTSSYLPGALCLAKSLAMTGTGYPLFVAISPEMPAQVEAMLSARGLGTLRLSDKRLLPREFRQSQHYWANTFDKLHIFGLTSFEKLVYVDSDMMVLRRIDELFEKPHMSAVQAGRYVNPDWVRLNSGLMVIEPRRDLPDQIGQTLDEALQHAESADRHTLGDQDLINAYYEDWPRSGLQLDESYNVLQEYVDAYLEGGICSLPMQLPASVSAATPIKVVHFSGPTKPWQVEAVIRHHLQRAMGHAASGAATTFRAYRKLLKSAISGGSSPRPFRLG